MRKKIILVAAVISVLIVARQALAIDFMVPCSSSNGFVNNIFCNQAPMVPNNGVPSGAPPSGSALVLEDGSSFLLLEDNSSHLCLEGSAC